MTGFYMRHNHLCVGLFFLPFCPRNQTSTNARIQDQYGDPLATRLSRLKWIAPKTKVSDLFRGWGSVIE